MTALLVLHAPGDERGGARWREAFDRADWFDKLLAPDLPGHAGAPPPTGGAYESVDAAFAVLGLLADLGDERPVIMGIAQNGWPAELLALGGRAAGLILVDGLGGPWVDARGWIDEGRRWLRAIADDPLSLSPAPAGEHDPRLRHGIPGMTSRSMAERAAAELTVPLLVIETPSSALSAEERDDLVRLIPGVTTVVELGDRDPATVVDRVGAWCSTTMTGTVSPDATRP